MIVVLNDICMEKAMLNGFYEPESVRNFNQQIRDEFAKNVEILERELLQLTESLILKGNLNDPKQTDC
jgi:hypothetical protein